MALAPGDSVGWSSGGSAQGGVGNPWGADNGCGTAGLCGLPFSMDGFGGGWQLCFA